MAHEAWLESLRREVYQELFQATWGGWDETRHARHFAACWERGGISIVEMAGAPVGMIQLLEQPDAMEIGEIQIALSQQNRGIGTRVLRDIIARAHGQRKTILLAVGLKNDKAYRLYARLGFRQLLETQTHHHLASDPPP